MDVEVAQRFRKSFFRLKHKEVQWQAFKLVLKIVASPHIGKPMRNFRKGTRELYLGSLRISYVYSDSTLKFVDIYHKDEQ